MVASGYLFSAHKDTMLLITSVPAGRAHVPLGAVTAHAWRSPLRREREAGLSSPHGVYRQPSQRSCFHFAAVAGRWVREGETVFLGSKWGGGGNAHGHSK